MEDSDVVYFDTSVVITKNIASISRVSYPIRAITSITVLKRGGAAEAKSAFNAGFVAVFVGLGLLGIAVMSGRMDGVALGFLGFFGGAFLVISAIGLSKRAAEYSLVIVTAAGERVAMNSPDAAYLQHIRTAIEHAIQIQ